MAIRKPKSFALEEILTDIDKDLWGRLYRLARTKLYCLRLGHVVVLAKFDEVTGEAFVPEYHWQLSFCDAPPLSTMEGVVSV